MPEGTRLPRVSRDTPHACPADVTKSTSVIRKPKYISHIVRQDNSTAMVDDFS